MFHEERDKVAQARDVVRFWQAERVIDRHDRSGLDSTGAYEDQPQAAADERPRRERQRAEVAQQVVAQGRLTGLR
jgi:hypothetical protein